MKLLYKSNLTKTLKIIYNRRICSRNVGPLFAALAGLKLQLSLETDNDGQIWVNSWAAAGDVLTQALVVLDHDAAVEALGRVGKV